MKLKVRLNTRWKPSGVQLRVTFLAIVVVFGAVGFALAPAPAGAQERTFTVKAFKYGYDPGIIRVNRGDTVRLQFVSQDVVHGFYLEGYDLDVRIFPMRSQVELRKPSVPGKVEQVEEVGFVANREGKFRFRCSNTCGFMHPFMLGELVVGPNRLLPASLGMALGILLAGCALVAVKGGRS